MTTERFAYQRNCAMMFPGKIVEIGVNDDPAGHKQVFGDRIVQCDRYEWDEALNYAIRADRYFDAGNEPWPFEDDEFELCIMGDVFEHLYPEEGEHALREAHRVATHLCMTVPEDHRVEEGTVIAAGSCHVVVCTEEYIRGMFEKTGWEIIEMRGLDYVSIPWGFFILARRA